MKRFIFPVLALSFALVFTSCTPESTTGVANPAGKSSAVVQSNGATHAEEEWTGTFELCDGTLVDYTVGVKSVYQTGENNDGSHYYKASQNITGTGTDADGNEYNVKQNTTVHTESGDCIQTVTQVASLRFVQKGTGKVYHVKIIIKATIDYCNNTIEYDLEKIEPACD